MRQTESSMDDRFAKIASDLIMIKCMAGFDLALKVGIIVLILWNQS